MLSKEHSSVSHDQHNDLYLEQSAKTEKLRQAADGIWYADQEEVVSYPDSGNDSYFEIEDKSFWFRHRNNCICSLVERFPPPAKGPIYDVGGGNGYVAKRLMDAGFKVVLIEPRHSGASNAKKRGVRHVICATTHTAGLSLSSLPAIGVFDVLEHIKDDHSFLLHLAELLQPNGMLYLTVPAYNVLWSQEDVKAGHYRRYCKKDLSSKLTDAGFEIAYASYIFNLLPLPIFILRVLPYRLGLYKLLQKERLIKKDHVLSSGFGNFIVMRFHKVELEAIQLGKNRLFGGSCLIAARKVKNL